MPYPSKSPTTGRRQEFPVGARWSDGFSLVELMVATVILTLIMVMVLSITDQTSKIWKRSTSEIQSFQNARAAYGTMTQRLSQATLNTYLDYYSDTTTTRTPANASTFIPKYYARNSNLHFVVDQASTLVPGTANLHPGEAAFFQAPLGFTLTSATYGGLPNMLNACGYYLEFNTDQPYLPAFLTSSTVVQQRYRYRLMEFMQPTEANTIYSSSTSSSGTPPLYDNWFRSFLPPNVSVSSAPLRVLSENIVALAILPELSPYDQSNPTAPTNLVGANYNYDTRAGDITVLPHHQLPPLLRVVMVAIDEPSALHLTPSGTTTPPSLITSLNTFKTTTSADPNTDINTDLKNLTGALTAQKVNYRVFDTDIAIRGAKWSTQ